MYGLLKRRLKSGIFRKLISIHGTNTVLRYYYFINSVNILTTIRPVS